MKQEAFILSDHIKTHQIVYVHSPLLWQNLDRNTIDRVQPVWTEVKFLNDVGDDISDDVKALPDNSGGIYIFIIKCDILPTTTEHLAYIGRAQYSANHNLRVRCRKYYYEYFQENGRPKITRMIAKWGNNLHLKYATIASNNDIVELEAQLINSILPPFNDQIPEKKIRQAVNAF